MSPAIFFLHGFPNNGRLWEKQRRPLAKLGQVIVVDWAASPRLDEAIGNVTAHAAQLRAEQPGRPVLLVAHDLGGFVASEATRLHPHLFAAQVLINGAGLAQFTRRWFRVSQWLRSSYVTLLWTLPSLEKIAQSRFGHRVRQLFYTLGGVGSRSRVRRPEYNDVRAIRIYRELGLRALRAMWRRSSPSPVPTLLVAGKNDPFLILPSAHEVRSSFTNGTRVTVAGGHWLPVTHPRAINALITNFVSGVLK